MPLPFSSHTHTHTLFSPPPPLSLFVCVWERARERQRESICSGTAQRIVIREGSLETPISCSIWMDGRTDVHFHSVGKDLLAMTLSERSKFTSPPFLARPMLNALPPAVVMSCIIRAQSVRCKTRLPAACDDLSHIRGYR